MSWKSFAFLTALSFATAPALAIPSLTFVDNADGTGVFQISPDPSLFQTVAGGSIAYEIEITSVTSGALVGATVDTTPVTGWPRANPGDFDSGVASGLNFDASSLTAAYGSDLFTTGDAVDALSLDFGGAATFNYSAVVAQNGASNPFSGSFSVTSAAAVTGDFSGDGKVDNDDLNLLLGNWGNTVPPTPSGWIGQQPTAPAVDNDELNDLLGNWGFGVGVAVPEPASALILTLACVTLGGVRRNG